VRRERLRKEVERSREQRRVRDGEGRCEKKKGVKDVSKPGFLDGKGAEVR